MKEILLDKNEGESHNKNRIFDETEMSAFRVIGRSVTTGVNF